jgi:UDP-N-acetylglucosamine:LPS N-acetylglucosamine transferase
MPDWMTASDAVVTNGGGATALEALSAARPVIMFEPIAGHGRANAAVMGAARAGPARPSPGELTAIIRRLAGDSAACARQAAAARGSLAGRRLDLTWLAAAAPP